MSDLMENAKFKHFTAQITTIYQFYRFTIEIIDFFVVNLIIWRSFDTYHVIIDVIIDVNLYPIWWKTQICISLLTKEPQYIEFIGFNIDIIDFWCYFNDLTIFWQFMASYHVIFYFILCPIWCKTHNLNFFHPEEPQNIDFIGFTIAIINLCGYFIDLAMILNNMTP